jgi:hypothetical protein
MRSGWITPVNQGHKVEPQEATFFSCHFLHNRSPSDVSIIGYIEANKLNASSPEDGRFLLVHPVRMKFHYAAHREEYVSIVNTKLLMIFREVNGICCGNGTKRKCTL